MHKRDSNRSFAYGICDAFDIAPTNISDAEYAWQARFKQVRSARERPFGLLQIFF